MIHRSITDQELINGPVRPFPLSGSHLTGEEVEQEVTVGGGNKPTGTGPVPLTMPQNIP